MANKALAKRQKMTIRVEPSQQPFKARNQRVPGVQRKAVPGTRMNDAAPGTTTVVPRQDSGKKTGEE